MTNKTINMALGENIEKMFDKSNYIKIDEGFFKNAPSIYGYVFPFEGIESPQIFIIINENTKETYGKDYARYKDYVFIVFNTSFSDYFNNIEGNILAVLTLCRPFIKNSEDVSRIMEDGLPYGYYLDDSGDIKINREQASELRKIYELYLGGMSIRDIVDHMNSNFSHVRSVLTDDRYEKMPRKIVPGSKLKKARALTDNNRKNRYDKEKTKSLKYGDITNNKEIGAKK